MTFKYEQFLKCLSCNEPLTSGFSCQHCGFLNTEIAYISIEIRKNQRLSGKKDPFENQLKLFD